jgi:hypothetical protein
VIEERKKEKNSTKEATIKGKQKERHREDPVCDCLEILRPITSASQRKKFISKFLKRKEKAISHLRRHTDCGTTVH